MSLSEYATVEYTTSTGNPVSSPSLARTSRLIRISRASLGSLKPFAHAGSTDPRATARASFDIVLSFTIITSIAKSVYFARTLKSHSPAGPHQSNPIPGD